ncbi:Fasciclin [Candida maltosa Xu316]|uniref:Fasciclin n=1 Tax=Candida maltosa (strain Xu316) TaxID=1245528 RepID=M3JYX2_CANMX|nr:Fasciclin [Candida maltosa Xu316]
MKLYNLLLFAAFLMSTVWASQVACIIDNVIVSVIDSEDGVCEFDIPDDLPTDFKFYQESDYKIYYYFIQGDNSLHMNDYFSGGKTINVPASDLYGINVPLYQGYMEKESDEYLEVPARSGEKLTDEERQYILGQNIGSQNALLDHSVSVFDYQEGTESALLPPPKQLPSAVACVINGQTVSVVDYESGICDFPIPVEFRNLFEFYSERNYDIYYYYIHTANQEYRNDYFNEAPTISVPAKEVYEAKDAIHMGHIQYNYGPIPAGRQAKKGDELTPDERKFILDIGPQYRSAQAYFVSAVEFIVPDEKPATYTNSSSSSSSSSSQSTDINTIDSSVDSELKTLNSSSITTSFGTITTTPELPVLQTESPNNIATDNQNQSDYPPLASSESAIPIPVACIINNEKVSIVDYETGVCEFELPSRLNAMFRYTSIDNYEAQFYYTNTSKNKYFTDIIHAQKTIRIPASELVDGNYSLNQVYDKKVCYSNTTISTNNNSSRNNVYTLVNSLKKLTGTKLDDISFSASIIASSSIAPETVTAIGEMTETEYDYTVVTLTSCSSDSICSMTTFSAVMVEVTTTIGTIESVYTTYSPIYTDSNTATSYDAAPTTTNLDSSTSSKGGAETLNRSLLVFILIPLAYLM